MIDVAATIATDVAATIAIDEAARIERNATIVTHRETIAIEIIAETIGIEIVAETTAIGTAVERIAVPGDRWVRIATNRCVGEVCRRLEAAVEIREGIGVPAAGRIRAGMTGFEGKIEIEVGGAMIEIDAAMIGGRSGERWAAVGARNVSNVII